MLFAAILLSLGAIDAFIPLIIIFILIAAAAGSMRGYSIFNLFGIATLAGLGTITGRAGGGPKKNLGKMTTVAAFKLGGAGQALRSTAVSKLRYAAARAQGKTKVQSRAAMARKGRMMTRLVQRARALQALMNQFKTHVQLDKWMKTMKIRGSDAARLRALFLSQKLQQIANSKGVPVSQLTRSDLRRAMQELGITRHMSFSDIRQLGLTFGGIGMSLGATGVMAGTTRDNFVTWMYGMPVKTTAAADAKKRTRLVVWAKNSVVGRGVSRGLRATARGLLTTSNTRKAVKQGMIDSLAVNTLAKDLMQKNPSLSNADAQYYAQKVFAGKTIPVPSGSLSREQAIANAEATYRFGRKGLISGAGAVAKASKGDVTRVGVAKEIKAEKKASKFIGMATRQGNLGVNDRGEIALNKRGEMTLKTPLEVERERLNAPAFVANPNLRVGSRVEALRKSATPTGAAIAAGIALTTPQKARKATNIATATAGQSLKPGTVLVLPSERSIQASMRRQAADTLAAMPAGAAGAPTKVGKPSRAEVKQYVEAHQNDLRENAMKVRVSGRGTGAGEYGLSREIPVEQRAYFLSRKSSSSKDYLEQTQKPAAEDRLNAAKTKVKDARDNVADLQAKQNRLAADKEQLQSNMRDAEGKIGTKQIEINAEKAKAGGGDPVKLARLDGEMNGLQKARKDLGEQADALDKSKISKQLKEANGELKAAQSEQKRAQNSLDKTNEKLDAINKVTGTDYKIRDQIRAGTTGAGEQLAQTAPAVFAEREKHLGRQEDALKESFDRNGKRMSDGFDKLDRLGTQRETLESEQRAASKSNDLARAKALTEHIEDLKKQEAEVQKDIGAASRQMARDSAVISDTALGIASPARYARAIGTYAAGAAVTGAAAVSGHLGGSTGDYGEALREKGAAAFKQEFAIGDMPYFGGVPGKVAMFGRGVDASYQEWRASKGGPAAAEHAERAKELEERNIKEQAKRKVFFQKEPKRPPPVAAATSGPNVLGGASGTGPNVLQSPP